MESQESKELIVREEEAAKLAEKVQKATMEQIKGQLEADMRLLRAALPSRDSQAVETAKDMKYVKDRQLQFDCKESFFSRGMNSCHSKSLG